MIALGAGNNKFINSYLILTFMFFQISTETVYWSRKTCIDFKTIKQTFLFAFVLGIAMYLIVSFGLLLFLHLWNERNEIYYSMA